MSGGGSSDGGSITVIGDMRSSFNGFDHASTDLFRVYLEDLNTVVVGGRGSIGDGEGLGLDLACGDGGFVKRQCAVAFRED